MCPEFPPIEKIIINEEGIEIVYYAPGVGFPSSGLYDMPNK